MGKWIDADALIESIKNTADLGGWIGEALYQIKQVAIKYIDSAPTIEPNLILPERMERGDIYEVGETIVVMNHDDYYDLLCKSWMPKRGEWIDMGDFEQCSVCKGTRLKEFQSYYGKTTWIKTPFCPNCGADMREREGER